tara:strand:+ start:542 stop:730 length:189 start_codon:yes stop_codon:yes gene_type:complete
MNIDPVAVPIPIPQDRVITDWPVKNKQQRVEETAKAIDRKSDKYRYDSAYKHHRKHIDFIVA